MQCATSAYEIIERKGATYYGIGMAAARIAEAVVRDSHAVVPVSVSLSGEYGLDGLCLSIPTIIGNKGAGTGAGNQSERRGDGKTEEICRRAKDSACADWRVKSEQESGNQRR